MRYEPMAGEIPRIRTGYYYLPAGWHNTTMPVMVLFHGLAGYGVSIIDAGSQGTYQVGLWAWYRRFRALPVSRTGMQ